MASCAMVEFDRCRIRNVSWLAWTTGFFFGFRALIPLAVMRLFGAPPETGAEIRLALGFGLLGLTALDAMLSASRTPISLTHSRPIWWTLLYLTFAGLSLLWSTAASPAASAVYLCGTASDVAIMILLLRSAGAMDVAFSTMRGFIWSACVIALVAWVMPAEYDLRLGDQDYFNANTIANICAFAICFAQYLIRRSKARLVLQSFFLGVTLLRSLSKATIAAFLLSEGVFLIRDRSMSHKAKFWITAGTVFSALLFWALFESYYDLYTSTGNQAETLTGRTAIWAYVLEAAAERPWIGYGFDSMWKVVPAFGTFEARHAENEILQQLYAFGASGVVILCGIYGSLYRVIRVNRVAAEKLVFTCLLLFVVVRGLAEADPFDLLFPLWCVVLISVLAGHNTSGTASLSESVPAEPELAT